MPQGQMCLPLWSEKLDCSFCNNLGLQQTWYGVPSISLSLCFPIKQRRRECSLASFSTDYGVVEPIRPRLLMEGTWQRLTWGQSKLQHGKAQRGKSQGSRWGQWVFCLRNSIFPSLYKNNFIRYRILGWCYFFLQTVNALLHSLLVCMVFEENDLILILVLL